MVETLGGTERAEQEGRGEVERECEGERGWGGGERERGREGGREGGSDREREILKDLGLGISPSRECRACTDGSRR